MKISNVYFIDTVVELLKLPLEETKDNVYGLSSANIDIDKTDGLLVMFPTKEHTVATTVVQPSDFIEELLIKKIGQCLGGSTVAKRLIDTFEDALGPMKGVMVTQSPEKATVLVYDDRSIVFTDNYTSGQINHFGKLTGRFNVPSQYSCLDRHDDQVIDEIDMAMGASCSGGMSQPNHSESLLWSGHDSSQRAGFEVGESILFPRLKNRTMNPALANELWLDLITLSYSGSIMSMFERVYHLLSTYQVGVGSGEFETRECLIVGSEYDKLVDKTFEYLSTGENIPSFEDVERAYFGIIVTMYLASMADSNYIHEHALHDLLSGLFGSKYNGEVITDGGRYRVSVESTFLGGIGEKLKAEYTAEKMANATMHSLNSLCEGEKWNMLPMTKKVSLYRFFSEIKRFKIK